ncbi:MAG TPA: V-type ATP synthase subunit D [Spirochaetia bacterium]|nr:V-type ATP synthase subunit D [Spirochaetia bacterium]
MDQISPTRSELLSRRAQIHLARQGADLLRNKREALVREFLSELQRFMDTREAMTREMAQARHSLMRALAVDGPEALASAGLASRRSIEIQTTQKSIWGTKIVELETDYTPRTSAERGFSAAGASARIDETAERFEAVVELLLRVAPLDRKLTRLAEEIRRTSRRVNALEQRMLPALQEQVTYIRGVLDQREREDVLRLKHLKGMRQ